METIALVNTPNIVSCVLSFFSHKKQFYLFFVSLLATETFLNGFAYHILAFLFKQE